MFFDHRVSYAMKERRHLLESLLGTSETVWEGMLHYRAAAGQAVAVGLELFPAVRDDKVRGGGGRYHCVEYFRSGGAGNVWLVAFPRHSRIRGDEG